MLNQGQTFNGKDVSAPKPGIKGKPSTKKPPVTPSPAVKGKTSTEPWS